ncbi:hypothetical protein [Porphyromonas sp.]
MGIVIGIGQTKPQTPYDQFYGIEWDVTVSNPKAKRIGKLELHASLPVQSLMRRCVLRDNGEVAYYLDANDSTKKEGGAPAKLDGTDGQVMVEIPAFYVKFESEGNKRRCLMSLHALPGFAKWEKLYVSAYEATIQRSTSKLSSVVNAMADYRGGDNNASYDGTYRSLLGRPASALSLDEARTFARNRGGASWNSYTYQAHKAIFWLFAVEYCTFNSQDDFTSALDNGLRQGGLGGGVTSVSNFSNSPFVSCGVTNSIGNSSGVVAISVDGGSGRTIRVDVPSYRGVEMPFGHIWKVVDGAKLEKIGGVSKLKVSYDKERFGDNGSYKEVCAVASTSGFIRSIAVGAYGEIVPLEVGGSSTTYFCDSASAFVRNDGRLMFGGNSSWGANCGILSQYELNASDSFAYCGTRLCYLP